MAESERTVDIAILDGYHREYESQRSGCQEQASRANQGCREWRNSDHLPTRYPCRGHHPDKKAESQKTEARNTERKNSHSRYRLVEANVGPRSRRFRRRA